jgi:xanthine dehydrogenase molybdopterin-binding subunit B
MFSRSFAAPQVTHPHLSRARRGRAGTAAMESGGHRMVTYHVIGQPTRWVDGAEKVTGHARYAADVSLPGTLWGKSLHSPYAHARIVRINTTAA